LSILTKRDAAIDPSPERARVPAAAPHSLRAKTRLHEVALLQTIFN
jgi:hypothetical protein